MAPKHKHPSMMNPADWPHSEGLQEGLGVHRREHRPPNGSFHSPHYSTATASSCCFQEELEGKFMVAMFPSSSLVFPEGCGNFWSSGWSLRLHAGTRSPAVSEGPGLGINWLCHSHSDSPSPTAFSYMHAPSELVLCTFSLDL